jgi:hypothetical protein
LRVAVVEAWDSSKLTERGRSIVGSPLPSSAVKSFFLIPFYLQAVQIHSANGVKLLEA